MIGAELKVMGLEVPSSALLEVPAQYSNAAPVPQGWFSQLELR